MDLSEDWYLSFDHKDNKKIATIDNEKSLKIGIIYLNNP
jgi:hypothetical protein